MIDPIIGIIMLTGGTVFLIWMAREFWNGTKEDDKKCD